MRKQTNKNFGKLLNKNYTSLNENPICFLFKDNTASLNSLGVIEVERKIALEQLRSLTTELQTKSLKNRIKTSSNYFSL